MIVAGGRMLYGPVSQKDTWIMGKAARISILGRRPCAAGPPKARLQHSVQSSD